MKPKILMIVNEFPPVGESGVQRPLKFLKYLDRAGWETFVLTPKHPTKTVLDPSLCNEIPVRSRIIRTFSLGFGGKSGERAAHLRFAVNSSQAPLKAFAARILKTLNTILFPLDKQIGWVPFAYLAACRLIKKHTIRNVYITAFPYSAFLVGILLKLRFAGKISWVADYRDTWQFEPRLLKDLPGWRKWIVTRFDRKTLQTCDHAVFVTDVFRERYIQAYPWLKNKASTITNGYDEDDFSDLKANAYQHFTLMHMGKLNSLERIDPRPLLRAVSSNSEQDIRVVFIGTLDQDTQDAISSFDCCEYQGYKPHKKALQAALGADVNLMLISDDAYHTGHLPGKLFELLRLGRPILVLGPSQGALKDLIEQSNTGECAQLGDVQGIGAALQRLRQNPDQYKADLSFIRQHSREQLCRRLMDLYA